MTTKKRSTRQRGVSRVIVAKPWPPPVSTDDLITRLSVHWQPRKPMGANPGAAQAAEKLVDLFLERVLIMSCTQ